MNMRRILHIATIFTYFRSMPVDLFKLVSNSVALSRLSCPAARDAQTSTTKNIILVTDGGESCSGQLPLSRVILQLWTGTVSTIFILYTVGLDRIVFTWVENIWTWTGREGRLYNYLLDCYSCL